VADRIFCQIRVKGHLSSQWADWFGGLEIKNLPGGAAVLFGTLPDQAALYGILNRMRDLGLELISLNCFEPSPHGISHPRLTGDKNPQQGGK
jgi:hypothetical protein